MKRMDLDVLHDPFGVGPLLLNNLPYKRVITIHSLVSLVYKAYGLSANDNSLGVIAYKLMGTRIRKVDRVIAISSCIKQELIRYLKVPEDKITVVHHGVKEMFKPLLGEELCSARKKYDLNQPYILYVGVLENRKNILSLIKAYSSLREHHQINHRLLLVGPKGVGSESIFQMVEKRNLQKEVQLLGYVPLNDLPAIYNMADIFVFPSIYEPFGLPPLEAMACGTPVIASNTGGLPEVVDNAGILVNPLILSEIEEAMWTLLSDDHKRKEMSNKGLARAKLFNWKTTAEATLKIYQDLN